jgi:hypothetical protein
MKFNLNLHCFFSTTEKYISYICHLFSIEAGRILLSESSAGKTFEDGD